MMGLSDALVIDPDVEVPSDRVLKRLKLSREVAWYTLSRGWDLPRHPPLVSTRDGSVVRGAVFDPERVDRVIKALLALRHTQGRLAGQPLRPDAWQVCFFLAPVFGWLVENDFGAMVRVVRTAFMEVPRKNGKSTLCGGLGLYLTGADGEHGAQVIAAATTKSQAGFVFNPARQLVQKSPTLLGKFIAKADMIEHPRTGSRFLVTSSAADAQHGANIHGAIIDELHVHKNRELVDVIESGTGSRDQPLVVKITTTDVDRPGTVYDENRKYICDLAAGVFTDQTTFGVIFGLSEVENSLDPKNFPRANPGYPISPTHDYLMAESKKARNSPAQLARFRRLHMGVRTRIRTQFIDLGDWDKNAGARIDEKEFHGRACVGGLDLGSTSDLTSLCWLFKTGHDQFAALWRMWTPEENLDELDKRTAGMASTVWVPQGWLTLTPGDVTDYDFIEHQIMVDSQKFAVSSIGMDMWNGQTVANHLMDKGLEVLRVQQGYVTLSPVLKEVQRLVKLGRRGAPRIRHGGNPVMRWMISNLAVAADPAGNVKPDKARASDKIDGVSAMLDAMSEFVHGDAGQVSAYEGGAGVQSI